MLKIFKLVSTFEAHTRYCPPPPIWLAAWGLRVEVLWIVDKPDVATEETCTGFLLVLVFPCFLHSGNAFEWSTLTLMLPIAEDGNRNSNNNEWFRGSSSHSLVIFTPKCSKSDTANPNAPVPSLQRCFCLPSTVPCWLPRALAGRREGWGGAGHCVDLRSLRHIARTWPGKRITAPDRIGAAFWLAENICYCGSSATFTTDSVGSVSL